MTATDKKSLRKIWKKRASTASFGLLMAVIGLFYFHFHSQGPESLPIANTPAINVAGQSSNEVHTPTTGITFRFNKATLTGYLQANAATRLDILEKIANELQITLLYHDDEKPFLEETLEIVIEGKMDDLFSELLASRPYRFIQTTNAADQAERQLEVCIGRQACSAFYAFATWRNNIEPEAFDNEESEVPAYVKEVLDQDVTPDSDIQVDYKQRVEKLKQQFPYLGSKTKLDILRTLDVNVDSDFFIDVLVFEESTKIREAAANRMFPTNNERTLAALLEELNDQDDIFVVKILEILNRSTDEDLRYQVSKLLSNHSSLAVVEALKNYQYPTL